VSETKFKASEPEPGSLEYARRERKKKFFDPTKHQLNERWDPLAIDERVCMPVREAPEPIPPTVLSVPGGTYEIEGSRYPLLRLVVEVVKHRAWHWLKGDGFRD